MKSNNKFKILVMAHGGATDMKRVAEAIKKGKLDAEIVALICDNPEAVALKRAKKYGIPTVLVELKGKSKNDRKKFDKQIMAEVGKYSPDLILLLGWMKILGPGFVKRYSNITWNVHPAPLPMFAGGMDRAVHEEILKRGAPFTGATLMYIDKGPDTGPIIAIRMVKVRFNDTVDVLRDRVQKAEQDLIMKYIPFFMDGRLKIVRNAYGGKWVQVLEPDSE